MVFLTQNLFNPPSIFSTRAFGSLFWAGARYLYLVSFAQGPSIFFPFSICIALCCEYILSICMKYLDKFVNQNMNLVLIGQHSH